MSDNLEYSLIGIEELNAKLNAITDDLKYKGGRFALRKAANIVRDQAKANASRVDDPSTPNSIAENIAVRFSSRTFKAKGDIKFRVGILGGAKGPATAVGELKGKGASNPGGDTYYWRFIEFGTEEMAAKPFFRTALSKSISAATDEFVVQYGKSIDRALKRAARQSRS